MPITEAQRQSMKSYREKNLEEIKEYQRNYRKEYYKKNKEKLIVKQRLAYQLLKESNNNIIQ
jgi:hypothetical protein